MRNLRVLAPAKVNLYLGIVGIREDGYHEIETLFQAVDLYDELIFEEHPAGVRLRVPGHPELEGPDNLVMRAVKLLESEAGEALPIAITLTKRIPIAGGLGGGSSDAAAALVGMRAWYGLPIGDATLASMAASLGADVPFFLIGGCAVGEGIGDRLTPTSISCDDDLVIVNPGFPVSTATIYRAYDRDLTHQGPRVRLHQLLQETKEVRRILHNDLQPVAEKSYPAILEMIQTLHECGLSHCLMSGSGPSVFGIFNRDPGIMAKLSGRSGDGWSICPVKPISHGIVVK